MPCARPRHGTRPGWSSGTEMTSSTTPLTAIVSPFIHARCHYRTGIPAPSASEGRVEVAADQGHVRNVFSPSLSVVFAGRGSC
ncbi:hypothetical protein LIA77_09177 [Sarocladium implicatum]|nr:hypothetical protein LIA77_09177 [Sarocladium implicatum]